MVEDGIGEVRRPNKHPNVGRRAELRAEVEAGTKRAMIDRVTVRRHEAEAEKIRQAVVMLAARERPLGNVQDKEHALTLLQRWLGEREQYFREGRGDLRGDRDLCLAEVREAAEKMRSGDLLPAGKVMCLWAVEEIEAIIYLGNQERTIGQLMAGRWFLALEKVGINGISLISETLEKKRKKEALVRAG